MIDACSIILINFSKTRLIKIRWLIARNNDNVVDSIRSKKFDCFSWKWRFVYSSNIRKYDISILNKKEISVCHRSPLRKRFNCIAKLNRSKHNAIVRGMSSNPAERIVHVMRKNRCAAHEHDAGKNHHWYNKNKQKCDKQVCISAYSRFIQIANNKNICRARKNAQ